MKKLLGGILYAVGILLMTGSGLCSLAVIVTGLSDDPNMIAMAWLPLLIGGVPFALGFGAFALGRSMIREAKAEEQNREAS